MAKKEDAPHGLTFPTQAMFVLAIISAIIVGASFEVIKFWPQPQAVEPYFDWTVGWIWGAVMGGFSGFVLGFLTDDNHFKRDLPDK